jgi:RNA-directed DNA polymerase
LLSNILLTELERRGHAFCRYADDCNIYVRSMAAGDRVMASITRLLSDTLLLTVNVSKSAVAHPWKRKFLGYSMTWHKVPRLRIAATSIKRLEDKIRAMLQGARGRNLSHTIQQLNLVLRGWAAYLKLTEPSAHWKNWMAGSGGNCAASYGASGNAFILVPAT